MNETILKASEVIDAEFADVVEQDAAKARLKEAVLGGLVQDGFFPNIMFVAPRGIGKSAIMRKLHKLTKELLSKTAPYFESGENLSTASNFFSGVLVPIVNQKHSVVFADEFHNAPRCIFPLVRDCLDPRIDRSAKLVKRGDEEIAFDPKKNSFVVATNRVDLLDPALVSRFQRINLEYYTDDGMSRILFQALEQDGIRFNEDTLRKVASCSRGTARDLTLWADEIRTYLAIAGKKTINREDVRAILKARNVYPLGLSSAEVRTMLFLRGGPQQLQSLAAKNLITSAEQKSNDAYLMQRNLVHVDGKRVLTAEGHAYLRTLEEEKYI